VCNDRLINFRDDKRNCTRDKDNLTIDLGACEVARDSCRENLTEKDNKINEIQGYLSNCINKSQADTESFRTRLQEYQDQRDAAIERERECLQREKYIVIPSQFSEMPYTINYRITGNNGPQDILMHNTTDIPAGVTKENLKYVSFKFDDVVQIAQNNPYIIFEYNYRTFSTTSDLMLINDGIPSDNIGWKVRIRPINNTSYWYNFLVATLTP
jgi:hypothetical protein